MGWLAALERDAWASCPEVHGRIARRWGGVERLARAPGVGGMNSGAGAGGEGAGADAARIIQLKEEAEMGRTYQEWVEEHTQQGVKP